MNQATLRSIPGFTCVRPLVCKNFCGKFEYLKLPVQFFDNLKQDVLDLNFSIEDTLKKIKPERGRHETNRVTFIIKLSLAYKELTGKEARLSRDRKGNRPTGPFFRLVKFCLDHIDDSTKIGDETLFREIKKALALKPIYDAKTAYQPE